MPDQIPADTAHLERLYYDASHWNRLDRHADSEQIVRSFARKKRAVFPSVVNAAELLNTPTLEDRRRLCGLMAAMHDEKHTILDHPEYVLKATAKDWRERNDSLILSESEPAQRFRALVAKPDQLDEEGKNDLTAWTDALKEDHVEFRRELDAILGEKGFAGNPEELIQREDFAGLLYARVPEVARAAESPEEVFTLVRETSVWAAYAGAIAYEFHLQGQELTKKERKKLPGGPDMRQLIYMGLVNRFVVRDQGMLAAARWVAGSQLPSGAVVEVLESDAYLARIGYPFAERSP